MPKKTAKKRELINVHYSHGVPMDGECSNCSWSKTTYLSAGHGPAEATAEFNAEFEAHDCSKFPKKKSREDVNQAAARILRQATSDE
jgi:hypothetical protein